MPVLHAQPHEVPERRLWRNVLIASVVLAAVAVAVVTFTTHVIGPLLFTHYDRFPALARVPKRTTNAKGAEGDPVNVAVVAGSDSELATAFARAGWTEA